MAETRLCPGYGARAGRCLTRITTGDYCTACSLIRRVERATAASRVRH